MSLVDSKMGEDKMKLYEFYAPVSTVPRRGLVAEGSTFHLNGKDISIYSGAMHYFRIHPNYWRETMQKLRAAGLNTVETYMAWNLHNPEEGEFDFGSGDNAMSAFLNIRSFVQMAQEEDLFVILRPGPYICSEWDFGGLPYWLLKDDNMSVRTSYPAYMTAVEGYYKAFSPQVKDLTFVKGGSIIAIQIENEYGYFGYEDQPRDKKYLSKLKDLMDLCGFGDTLYFTSDTSLDTLDWGALPGILQTTNFQDDVDKNLDALQKIQPNRPLMVMEFWTGWFDHWLDNHSIIEPNLFASYLESILKRKSSLNFYMFIGGTNFGFMAGANKDLRGAKPREYTPDVTSYDYDAPLSEAGDYTEKYRLLKELIARYNPLNEVISNPCPPPETKKVNFGKFAICKTIQFEELLAQSKETFPNVPVPVSMEELGLDYGYIVYSKSVHLKAGDHKILIRGHVRDMAQIIINGEVVTEEYSKLMSLNSAGFWEGRDKFVNFKQSVDGVSRIYIMVENLGRINYGKPHFFRQKKGLWEGDIMLDDVKLESWDVTLMGFKKNFINSLSNWSSIDNASHKTPSVYKALVNIPSPADTFLDMRNWNKGIVVLNGFNLGRYWSVGPSGSLYIPAPLLKAGENEFVIFEQYSPADSLNFIDHPILSLDK